MLPTKRTQNWLPGIFNDFFGNEWMERVNMSAPAINIKETDKAYKVEVAAPGLEKGDFDVKVNDENQLVISMQRKEEKNEEKEEGRYLRREFSYSQFRQAMILPDHVEGDKIEAKMKNGVLHITIPKSEPVPEVKKGRQIEIK